MAAHLVNGRSQLREPPAIRCMRTSVQGFQHQLDEKSIDVGRLGLGPTKVGYCTLYGDFLVGSGYQQSTTAASLHLNRRVFLQDAHGLTQQTWARAVARGKLVQPSDAPALFPAKLANVPQDLARQPFSSRLHRQRAR